MGIHEESTTHAPNPSWTLGLALIAGTGLVLMMIALGIGVVQGEAADGSVVGLTFAGGVLLLLIGIVGWLAVVQPFRNFDDINEAHYHGHHDHDEAHSDETAIIPHE